MRARGRGASGSLARDALKVARMRAFQWLVRAGFLARGLTYAVVGGIVVALALGAGREAGDANQQGALSLIAEAPLGRVALVVVCVSLLAYAVWKLGRGVFGVGPESGPRRGLSDRGSDLGGGVMYLAFFVVALRVLVGSSGNPSTEEQDAAAGVLGWPGGHLLVGLAGAGLMAISLHQIYEALHGRFARDNKLVEMSHDERRIFLTVGRVGLTARAIVFALVGYFLVRTAIDFRPSEGVGIDGALAQVRHQPLGHWLLGSVAVGLFIFAAFSFFEARYQRL
jgi:hypothetical protein